MSLFCNPPMHLPEEPKIYIISANHTGAGLLLLLSIDSLLRHVTTVNFQGAAAEQKPNKDLTGYPQLTVRILRR